MPVTELPLFETSSGTGRATAAVLSNRFLDISAAVDPALNTALDGGIPGVAHAGAGVKPAGVSMGAQPTVGKPVAFEGTPGRVVFVEAGAAVAVGAAIESDATGRAITRGTGLLAGKAWSAAGAAGTLIAVQLF